MGNLHGRVAIVTGGARGIGAAIAERYIRDGAKVAIIDLDRESGEALARRLGAGQAIYIHADVGDSADVRRMVKETLGAFGRIDILVNNAGIIHTADFLDIPEADFDRVLRVNLKGVFLVGQAVARQMVRQASEGGPPGVIINMSSINAVVAIPTQVPYCASKGGVDQLTKVMALSLAPYGIRVNAIGPGSIMTEILQTVAKDKDARHRLLARTPLRRVGAVEEIAGVAAFLASSDASYVTGQTIYADGGRLGLNYTVPVPDDA